MTWATVLIRQLLAMSLRGWLLQSSLGLWDTSSLHRYSAQRLPFYHAWRPFSLCKILDG